MPGTFYYISISLLPKEQVCLACDGPIQQFTRFTYSALLCELPYFPVHGGTAPEPHCIPSSSGDG